MTLAGGDRVGAAHGFPSRILVATGNPGKLREFREMLDPLGVGVISPREAGWSGEVVEDGDTLEANAGKKARAGLEATGLATVGDDSGLFVDALNGAPGVHSARFAGEGQDMAANCVKLLRELEGVPPERRGAAFRVVLALAQPGEPVQLFPGECRGRITTGSRGASGFGYDPYFELVDRGLTFAEMPSDEKHRISHRGRALIRLREYLRSLARKENP
jgi:XTP/dITP diphosphohydrolase